LSYKAGTAQSPLDPRRLTPDVPDETPHVGAKLTQLPTHPFVLPGVGMVGLGELPGGISYSNANDISTDGSTVVGFSYTADGQEAFTWDQANGMRNLRDVLINDWGLNLAGWTLSEARGISDDGLIVVGCGINPSGYEEAWVVTLPDPTTLSLLALGGLALLRRRGW